MREFDLSNALIHHWMLKFDAGKMDAGDDDQIESNHSRARVAALERKVGQLTMEIDLLRASSSAAGVDTGGGLAVVDTAPSLLRSHEDER
jgi:transposase